MSSIIKSCVFPFHFFFRQQPFPDCGLIYKFDLVLDVLEDDGKGSFSSVPRGKTCFKVRRDVQKQITIHLHQLSNRLLIIER